MKKIYLLIFVLLLSCTSGKKVYICGDHPCKNKKEIDDYFKNNISIEVYVIENDKVKKSNQDLVQLNLSKDKTLDKKNKKLDFLKERKKEILDTKKEQKPSKLKLRVKTENKEKLKYPEDKKSTVQSKRKFTYKKQKSTKVVHMCKNIEECDIDIISKKVIDLSKNKSFPDINFR